MNTDIVLDNLQKQESGDRNCYESKILYNIKTVVDFTLNDSFNARQTPAIA